MSLSELIAYFAESQVDCCIYMAATSSSIFRFALCQKDSFLQKASFQVVSCVASKVRQAAALATSKAKISVYFGFCFLLLLDFFRSEIHFFLQ